MTIKEAAKLYIDKGWAVVPLVPKGKACKDNNWTKLEFTPDMFRDGDNIGIRSVRGLVDIDCDAPEVVILASSFLPQTGTIYGRKNKPYSHWLYRSSFPKPIVYKDTSGSLGKTILIEIRVDHQSMAPPSVHPDGEMVWWEMPPGFQDPTGMSTGRLTVPRPYDEPSEVDPDALRRAVQLLAVAALIGRYYNPPGSRHDWGVSLAGTLKTLNLTLSEAEKVINGAATLSGDAQVADRLRAIHDTYSRPDGPVKGAKSLEELMLTGKQFVSSLRKILIGNEVAGMSNSGLTAVNKLNDKHAIIFQQSGDLVVVTEEKNELGHKTLRFSSLATIKDLYPEPVVVGIGANGRPVTKKLGQAWVDSPTRRFYNGIELAPAGKGHSGFYNLWQGFSVDPKPGDWSLFKEHIDTIICSKDPKLSAYVLSWMASTVQNPDKPGHTAIALRGGQGTGKSTFAKWFGGLFGPHFLHLDNTRQLTGNFNAHLHNAILVFADEAAWPGDKAGLGALRRMVTEDTLTIERKGVDVMTVPNLIHLILASNEDWIVPAAFDERRFAVLDVSGSRQNDREYFKAIDKQLFEDGGLSAMLYDLQKWEMTVDVRNIPKTKALLEQKQISSSPQMKWWFQALFEGSFWNTRHESNKKQFVKEGHIWRDDYRFPRDAMYANYIEVLSDAANYSRSPRGMKTELGMYLSKVLPPPYPGEARPGFYGVPTNAQRSWILPSLDRCRAFYLAKFGVTDEIVWPDQHAPSEDQEHF
mgnify:FL=1